MAVALFGFIGERGLRLHFMLFKHAKQSPFGDERSLIFTLHADVKAVMAELWQLVTSSASWASLESSFGHFDSWRADWRDLAVRAVQSLIGELKRRLLEPFEEAPWKYWVPLADPLLPDARKATILQELLDADPRVLDAASIRLRRRITSPEILQQPLWRKFLFHSVNKIGLASSFVECLFAHFKQWQDRAGRPIGVPLLSAKHVTHEFVAATGRKRQREAEREQGKRLARVKRVKLITRPVWAFKRGEQGQQNARHAFISRCILQRSGSSGGAFSAASVEWRSASPKAKARAKAAARRNNAWRRVRKLDLLQDARQVEKGLASLWGLGGGGESPLHRDSIEQLQATPGAFMKASYSWRDLMKTPTACAEDFPAVVPAKRLIRPAMVPLNDAQRKCVNDITYAMQTIYGSRGSTMDNFAKHVPKAPLLIKDSTTSSGIVIRPCSIARSPEFSANVLVLKLQDSDRADGFASWAEVPEALTFEPLQSQVWASVDLIVDIIKLGGGQLGGGPYTYHQVEFAEQGLPGIPGAIRATGLGVELDLEKIRKENAAKALDCVGT